MKVVTEEIKIKTRGNCDVINITDQAQSFISRNKMKEGSLSAFVVGSTASISTIEYEQGLKKDLTEILDKLIPAEHEYHHHDTWVIITATLISVRQSQAVH